MHRAGRVPAVLAALATAAVLCGCGTVASERTAATASPSPSASAVDTATAAPSASATASATASPSHSAPPASHSPTPSPAPTAQQVSEANNRGTVALRSGGTLTVVLHSTYWQSDPASDPSVLRSQGDPTYAPDPPGACVPGGGCGTVTATYHALRPGRVVVTAHRTSCGEAMACVGDAGHFSVTVAVSG
jgi:hypothetical protein